MDHPFRIFREREKISQEELARRLGISNMTVSRWELGLNLPRERHWPKIKQVTGLEPADLMMGKIAARQELRAAE